MFGCTFFDLVLSSCSSLNSVYAIFLLLAAVSAVFFHAPLCFPLLIFACLALYTFYTIISSFIQWIWPHYPNSLLPMISHTDCSQLCVCITFLFSSFCGSISLTTYLLHSCCFLFYLLVTMIYTRILMLVLLLFYYLYFYFFWYIFVILEFIL